MMITTGRQVPSVPSKKRAALAALFLFTKKGLEAHERSGKAPLEKMHVS